jgi:hypothetical protein
MLAVRPAADALPSAAGPYGSLVAVGRADLVLACTGAPEPVPGRRTAARAPLARAA